MDPKTFVYSAVLLLVVASVAVVLFRHLGLGSILGLLVTGVIVGPHTPGPFLTTEVDGVTVVRANLDRDRAAEFSLRIEDGGRHASAYDADDFLL